MSWSFGIVLFLLILLNAQLFYLRRLILQVFKSSKVLFTAAELQGIEATLTKRKGSSDYGRARAAFLNADMPNASMLPKEPSSEENPNPSSNG